MPIGTLARRSGLPVKTIRFYSDEGLLPPSGRTEAGYRLYGEVDLARLELIRTLREAGLDLATIRSVLDRRLSLGEALQLRLQAIEAHIVSLRRVAAAIRAAGPEPNDDDLRRLSSVTTISNEERRAVIARFFEQVGTDTPEYRAWADQMIAASVPDLPDEPTKEQLDAWIELSEILSDPGFIENMRSMSEASWSEPRPDFDQAAYHASFWQLMNDVDAATKAGAEASSPEADALVQRFVDVSAPLHGESDSPEFRRKLLGYFEGHDPRASRYWELVAIMKGDEGMAAMTAASNRATSWLIEALKARL